MADIPDRSASVSSSAKVHFSNLGRLPAKSTRSCIRRARIDGCVIRHEASLSLTISAGHADALVRRLKASADYGEWLKEVAPVRLLTGKKQWGNCSPNGMCVEYVIAHERCRPKERNHSPPYRRPLREIVPGLERVKARLDGTADLLLNERR
jgi:hypothetical protein